MSNSPNLGLPYLAAAQAQKHVTHNEALRVLDAVVQLAVLDKDLTTPPGSPADGDRYIVAASATGDWAGKDQKIAAWQDNAWAFYTPEEGWLAWVADEDRLYAWDGTNWTQASGGVGSLNPADGGMVGVNATADATNRLAVKADAVLFSHDDVTPGSGDMRAKLNKSTAANTASLLFQTNASGRAEFGLTGDDDWHVKTSPDGSTWHEALIADTATGKIRFPAGPVFSAQQIPVGQFVFTPGGVGEVSFYRVSRVSSPIPRSFSISAISGDVITLTTNDSDLVFDNGAMQNVAYIRIWNTSKSPVQSAWVKSAPAANQLQVTDSTHVSGWAAGETIQVGEPPGAYALQVAALDISPLMQNVLGTVFPQKGLVARSALHGGQQGDKIRLSVNGQTGSGIIGAYCQTTGASAGDGVILLSCTEPSPISNSNLVLVMEEFAGTAGVRLFSCLALFG